MRRGLALAVLLVACGTDDGGALSDADAERLVVAAVEAAVDVVDAPEDTGEDVSMPNAAEAWLECVDDGPDELAAADVRLQVGADDIVVARAAAYDGGVGPVVAAATPECVADAWGEEIDEGLDELGFGGDDIELEADGDDGRATVTGELLGFPIGFEARVAAVDGVDVAVVVLGGGSDVDGDAAGMVDDVVAAMVDAVEEAT